MKKATLEELITRKQQSLNDKLITKDVEIESIGLSITIKKLPLSRVLRMLDGQVEDSIAGKFELYKQLIYESVPLFQNEKLQKEYECAEPTDIVAKVLNDNIQDIGKLGDAICAFYGLTDGKVVNEIKN